jgi:ABC-2 type transport system ATP-binding protein
MNALEIKSLSKTYKGKKGIRVNALKDISLSISQGEIFGFLGPNGAGKSTTIKILMDLIRPTIGETFIMGHSSASSHARKQVGYLPENPTFYDFLSAEEYLNFVGNIYGMPKELLEKRKEEVLELLELLEARKRPIRTYSKGMVQRLGLAQVLIHDPDVYILDEPMSGLDPLGRVLVKNIILGLKEQGKCVFFSTHITADVESICDRVGIILKGELKRVDRVDSIMNEGIRGYLVRVREKESGLLQDHQVSLEHLASFLANKHDEGNSVILVEPYRNNLEEYFLQIVKGE